MKQSLAATLVVLSLVLLVSQSGFAAPAANQTSEDPSLLPWALRNHYTFSFEKATLLYAVENTEWSVSLEGSGDCIKLAKAAIVLGDGTTLDVTEFGPGETAREGFTSDMGDGNHFVVNLPAYQGLKVKHSMSVHKSFPFILIRMQVTNVSDKPIEISKLIPVQFGAGCINNLSGKMQGLAKRLSTRGGFPIFSKSQFSSLAVFHDAENLQTISLGVVPQYVGESGITLEPFAGSWHGNVTSAFEPALRLDPGQTLEADPVFFTFAVPQPSEVDTYFSWARSKLPRARLGGKTPVTWVTVDESESADSLCAAASEWSKAGVRNALVPAAWESKPGSLNGARPRYPKDMNSLVATLRGQGMDAGLTVDPLATQGGKDAWVAASVDGQRWINVSNPEGRAHALDQMREVVSWGFKFFVVDQSMIPDAVLKQFNMTRAQADAIALQVVAEAAGDLPVFPSVKTSIGDSLDEWLEAASCTSRLTRYNLSVGPVRFSADEASKLDDAVVTAMSLYGGPIELLGRPGGTLVKQISKLHGPNGADARPLDAAERSPKLWQLTQAGNGDESRTANVLAFPGAPEWNTDRIHLKNKEGLALWQAEDGSFKKLAAAAAPASTRMTVFAVAPVQAEPVVFSVSAGNGLATHEVQNPSWNGSEGTFSAVFSSGSVAGNAYVVVPQGWKFRSGKAGGAPVKDTADNTLVAVSLQPGSNTHLDLKFTRE